MFFKLNGYIHKIIDTHLYLELNDEEEYNKYINNLKILYKNNIPKYLLNNKIIKLKLTKKTKFNINNYNYNNISDLIGCNIIINFSSKFYSIKINKPQICDLTNEFIDNYLYKSGYVFLINTIKNN